MCGAWCVTNTLRGRLTSRDGARLVSLDPHRQRGSVPRARDTPHALLTCAPISPTRIRSTSYIVHPIVAATVHISAGAPPGLIFSPAPPYRQPV
eukprot:4038465-Pyramimonas_sp.AAC.1